ncbi:uncharacterized protein LOC110716351 [Chenopodium quinoa]|uniref:uncharacterized protein LOC110716351 n=1 Tax=Chenopodium quinoa TaxID=63459 RepID=UPI000B78801F|nr:uncharacterized protein LOC110716351 [Chenopodium quinoa]
MASQNVVLLCRWGGEMLFDGPRVEYSGGNMEPLTLEPNMTMNDLMNEVHSSIGSDPMTVDVHIKMRFETGNGVQVLPVSTNKHVTALRNVVAMKGVPYRRAWYAKGKAIADIYGDWESSYGRLPHFMQALQQSNPGTCVVWKYKALVDGVYYSNMEVFERVFWAFGPCIDGFKHCMSVICIDGTHLYGKYKGTLLVATSVDANFQVFPLAFALVEGENTSSWSWFLGCIRVHVTQRDGLCVISDRHPGIIAVMTDPNVGFTEPRAYHRFCVRHIASNLKTHVRRNDMRDMFKATAYQRQERKLHGDLCFISEACNKAMEYIVQIPFTMWSLFHDAGRRYGICTTNFSETFNNVLKGARFLPIMSLVELTFHRVNKYFTLRRESSEARFEQGLAYPPKVTAILEKNTAKARYHRADAYNRRLHIYQVTTERGDRLDTMDGRAVELAVVVAVGGLQHASCLLKLVFCLDAGCCFQQKSAV